jgi:ElaB/YqjD/DUF883 family membrane-anchored ribosome-binding protein
MADQDSGTQGGGAQDQPGGGDNQPRAQGGGGEGQRGVDVEQLKRDVAKLRDDFGQLIQSGAEAAREQVSMRVEGMRSAMGSMRSGGGRAVGKLSNKVEERPLAAVLVAFGVGVLVAKLMDR